MSEQIKGILAHIANLKDSHESDEDVDPTRVQQVLSRIEELGPRLAQAEVAAVKDALESLEEVVANRKQAVGEELDKVQVGRKAMRGYSRLRGMKAGQRLYRRA